jgi:hypothetical protein
MKSSLLSLLVIFGLSATLLSCGGEVAKSSFSSPSEGDDEDDGSGGGEVSSDAISIKTRSMEFPVTVSLHKFYDRTSACEIPTTAASPSSLQCLLNVRELDFFTGGMKLEFNVPKGMCAHIAYTPYFYYNNRPGVGAGSIQITRQVNGTGTCTVDGVTAGMPGVSYNAAAQSCSFPDGVAYMDGKIKCAYDYTSTGPNCCEGSYAITTTQINPNDSNGDPVAPTIVQESGQYGGSRRACVSSPAQYIKSGWQVDETKYPMTTYHSGSKGINRYFTIVAPIYLKDASNVYGANFFDWPGYSVGTFNPAAAPAPLAPHTDLSGSLIPGPNPAYRFYCLDESREVLHNIDLYINEWDSNIEFAKYLAGQTATPIGSGTCGPIPETCNDFRDWKTFSTFPGEDTSYDSSKEDDSSAE